MATEAITNARATATIAPPPLTLTPNAPHTEASERQVAVHTQDFALFYGSFRAITDITMDFHRQAITAIIGPSGCGKSTLLRSINRMNDLITGVHASGDITINGQSIYGPRTDTVALRKRVGMVFQRPNPFPMSIYENVIYGPKLHGEHNKRRLGEIAERSLRAAALWDEVKDKLKQSGLSLSGGQQQRLCIARSIAVQPDVILMDELASALDPISTLKVEDLMRELKANYTIIIVTHNMQQAARISDMTAFMLGNTNAEDRSGRLIEYGPTSQLFTQPKDKRTEEYITGRFG